MSSPTSNWSAEREAGFLAVDLINAGAPAPLSVSVMEHHLRNAYRAGLVAARGECSRVYQKHRAELRDRENATQAYLDEVRAESYGAEDCVDAIGRMLDKP